VQALIFDLDDTLLGSNKRVSEVNVRALRTAQRLGYQLINRKVFHS